MFRIIIKHRSWELQVGIVRMCVCIVELLCSDVGIEATACAHHRTDTIR